MLVISFLGGIILSPHAINFIRPLEYARGSMEDLGTITLYFSRLVLGVQLVLAGKSLRTCFFSFFSMGIPWTYYKSTSGR